MMEKKQERRSGLGRGLSALMADVQLDARPSEDRSKRADLSVPVEKVFPNPDQPRRHFAREALEELAASIREKGIIQPLIVRRREAEPSTYEIVAGERRWRAAQIAQLHEVPVLVRELSDTEVLEVAIIENIQRADLNPVEEAMSYRQLMTRFGHTQEKLAEALSKSRSHIANLMRLLQLPEEVQAYLREGKLTAGHARALITSENPAELARQVIARELSVRETEALVKKPKPAPSERRERAGGAEKDADTRALEGDLSANLGMAVEIEHKADGAGRISIRYETLEDLDRLCQILTPSRVA
ncbi:ParB/RepB/Spo0J family partition protein [Halodurantibacterium flavum]|uniref:ParB/RepB/Spo0J family partition protein n=1 Tax=Halodurantibacterium flavum TaxID=1382802 RepID=A0ABW4S869_9RHOB